MNLRLALLAAASLSGAQAAAAQPSGDSYLSWPASEAEAIGKAMRASGRAGGVFDLRVKSTNKSFNYKLRATWLTPEVIRATARLEQLRGRLSDNETRALVAEAENVGDTVVLLEIDPNEGSGVIPRDWSAFLQPRALPVGGSRVVRGTDVPRLRDVRALRGVVKRDYAYDQFWMVFPLRLQTGEPVLAGSDSHAEVVVRIFEKEGRVSWAIPTSIRRRISISPAQ